MYRKPPHPFGLGAAVFYPDLADSIMQKYYEVMNSITW